MYDCLREARALAAVLSFVIFRTHLDKAKHYKRLWVFIYIGSLLRHAPTHPTIMGVGTILWISSVVIGVPIVVLKLDRKISYNDCKNSYAWTLSGTITGTPGVCARAHARARGNSRSHACPAHAAMCFLGTDVTMPEFCAWSIARCLPRRILTPTSLARRRRPQFCPGDVHDLPQPRLPSRDVERDIGRARQPRRQAAF